MVFTRNSVNSNAAPASLLGGAEQHSKVKKHPIASAKLVNNFIGEFDHGSGRTLAACLKHASRTGEQSPVANGGVIHEERALKTGIVVGNDG